MSKEKEEPEPACRICGCTQERACDGGCTWVDQKEDRAYGGKVERGPLCSSCFDIKRALLNFSESSWNHLRAFRNLRKEIGLKL